MRSTLCSSILLFLSLCLGASSSLYPFSAAQASCGLSHCTLVRQSQTIPAWQGVSLFRATDDLSGTVYLENFLGLGWQPTHALSLMTLIPAVYIEGQSFGVGNSILQVDYQWSSKHRGIAVGIQGELPTSSEEQYGDRHSVALPYIRGWWTKGAFSTRFQLGFAQTLDFGHHSHGEPTQDSESSHADDHMHQHHGDHKETSLLVINPHTSSEVLVRAQLQWTPVPQTRLVEVLAGVDGIQEVIDQQNTLLNGLIGAQSYFSWGQLQILALLPISKHKRFNQRFIFSLNIPFGNRSTASSQTQSPLLTLN